MTMVLSFFLRTLWDAVLNTRYWDGSTPTERGKFEHDLYLQTRPEWIEIKPPQDDVDKYDQFKPHVSLVKLVVLTVGEA